MDKLICASLFHTHYWYEVGMLKVPAVFFSEGICCTADKIDQGTTIYFPEVF